METIIFLRIPKVRRKRECVRYTAAKVVRPEKHSHQAVGPVSAPGSERRYDSAQEGCVQNCSLVNAFDSIPGVFAILTCWFAHSATTTSRSWSTAPVTNCSFGSATACGCPHFGCCTNIRTSSTCSRWTRAPFVLCWAAPISCVPDWHRRAPAWRQSARARWSQLWPRAKRRRWRLALPVCRRMICMFWQLINQIHLVAMNSYFVRSRFQCQGEQRCRRRELPLPERWPVANEAMQIVRHDDIWPTWEWRLNIRIYLKKNQWFFLNYSFLFGRGKSKMIIYLKKCESTFVLIFQPSRTSLKAPTENAHI